MVHEAIFNKVGTEEQLITLRLGVQLRLAAGYYRQVNSEAEGLVGPLNY